MFGARMTKAMIGRVAGALSKSYGGSGGVGLPLGGKPRVGATESF